MSKRLPPRELSDEANELIAAGRAADAPTDLDRARGKRRLQATLGAAAFAQTAGMAANAAAAESFAASAVAGSKSAGLVGGSTGLGAAAASGKVGAALSLSAGLKLGIATLGLGAGIGIAGLSAGGTAGPENGEPARSERTEHDQRTPAPATPAVAAAEAEREQDRQQPTAPPPSAAASKPERPRAQEERSPRTRPAPAPKRSRRTKSLRRLSLQGELALIGAAQRSLSAGDAEQALRLVREHESAYPRGALRQERTAISAIALCKLGRTSEGSALALSLARHAPASPLSDRVEQACGLSQRW